MGLVLVQNSSQAHLGKSILVKSPDEQKNTGVVFFIEGGKKQDRCFLVPRKSRTDARTEHWG